MNVVDLNDSTATESSANNPSAEPTSSYTPDELTKERFRNLAVVGKALMQTESEDRYQTDYYIAKQALEKFVDLYNRLQLSEQDRAGMDQLIAYLQKKIDRRLNASLETSE